MILEILQDQPYTFVFYSQSPVDSVTVSVKNAKNQALVSDSGTCDTGGCTISGFTAPQDLLSGDVSDVVAGEKYVLISDTNPAVRDLVTVESITAGVGTAGTIKLSEVPHFTPVSGDSLAPSKVTYTLSADYTGTRDTHYRVEWSISDADDNVTKARTYFHIVAQAFESPVSAQDVKNWVTRLHANDSRRFTARRCEEISDAANAMIKERLLAMGRYAHLCGDPGVFKVPGQLALQWVLALDNLMPGDVSLSDYQKDIEKRLSTAIKQSVNACWYDSNDDQVVSVEEKPRVRVKRMGR